MHVRTMNEIEDCPTVTLKITYPDGYPQNEVLLIEFDYEDEEPDIDDDDLKDLRICLDNVVSELKLVSLELIHFGVIAHLFRQIGGHSM